MTLSTPSSPPDLVAALSSSWFGAVPQTSQNQGAIEADLAAFAPTILDLPHEEATRRLEMMIRAYDPCISCATHFLGLSIVDQRSGAGTG